MPRTLGLDLGSLHVRGVVVESSGRSRSVVAHAEVRRAESQEPDQGLAKAIHQLLAQPSLAADQVAVAIPGLSFASHWISLPFTDLKRIDATVGFEIEGQLPFDLAQAVYDYQLISTGPKGSELLVGVVPTDRIRSLLAILSEAQIDPKVLTLPAQALQPLLALRLDQMPVDGAVGILDVGHERTSLALGSADRALSFARTFAGGGKDLTKAIANELQTPLPDAERLKERASLLPSNEPQAERTAAALIRGLQPILREVRASLKAHQLKSRTPVGSIQLCGGSAALPGLDAQLAQDLRIPVERLVLPVGSEGSEPGPPGPAFALAYGLALRGQGNAAKGAGLNLRRGEFAFRGHFDYLKERAVHLAAMGGVLLLLFLGLGLARDAALASQERAMDDALCELTQRALGQCERNFDRALSLLRGKESPAAAVPKISAVGLLSEITDRIPADAQVTFDQIAIDLERITLRGETDSSKQVDRIIAALKGFRCFREVKPGKVEKTRGGQTVSFHLDIQVECPEQGATPG